MVSDSAREKEEALFEGFEKGLVGSDVSAKGLSSSA